jgi:enterochelin esterase family protein
LSSSVTFVFRGVVDSVHLQHWIFGLPSSQPFLRIEGTDLWYLTIELPEKSRFEYKLEISANGKSSLVNDPLNPFLARDPYALNSVAHGAGYEVPDWTLPDPDTRPGSLEEMRFDSRALGGERRVIVYLPARFRRTRRYPLLIVHDGPDYLNYAGMKTVLDNLIHRVEVAPMIVALSQPVSRLVEYANQRAHARFVTEELMPALEARFPLAPEPSSRGLMGASFGAVASLSTAWHYPGRYGRLLLQSGSFAFTDIGRHKRGPEFDPVVEFVNAFRDNPGKPTERIFVSCGMYESLIYENRSLVPLLQTTGMEVRYVEARDGHTWENWRDRMREGLSWLFPGPLWFVYE